LFFPVFFSSKLCFISYQTPSLTPTFTLPESHTSKLYPTSTTSDQVRRWKLSCSQQGARVILWPGELGAAIAVMLAMELGLQVSLPARSPCETERVTAPLLTPKMSVASGEAVQKVVSTSATTPPQVTTTVGIMKPAGLVHLATTPPLSPLLLAMELCQQVFTPITTSLLPSLL
jgi:hypothetical protein